MAFAHLDGRLWVTQVILSQMLARHFTNFYRFLESKAWSPAEVARQVWKHCQPYALQEGQRVFAAIDDTVAQKSGKHFDSLGVHHDPMNKQHPKGLSRGHCFVCLAVLAQQGIGHWVALFVSCALYVQKKACQKGRTFATKLTLAADLLKDLPIPAAGYGHRGRRWSLCPQELCASGRGGRTPRPVAIAKRHALL